MTEEPTYEYVKGRGWVPLTHRAVKVQLGDGTYVWFIDRKPKPGEYYVKHGAINTSFGTHDRANLERFAEDYTYYSFNYYDIRANPEHMKTYIYVTVELA